MPDDDLIYRKNLDEERIKELQREAKAQRYKENCIKAALVGTAIGIAAAKLLNLSSLRIYVLFAVLGAAGGYFFYLGAKKSQEKCEKDSPQKPSETNQE